MLVKGKRLTSRDAEDEEEENVLGMEDDTGMGEEATADYSTLEGVLSTASGRHVRRARIELRRDNCRFHRSDKRRAPLA